MVFLCVFSGSKKKPPVLHRNTNDYESFFEKKMKHLHLFSEFLLLSIYVGYKITCCNMLLCIHDFRTIISKIRFFVDESKHN
jgi:hypothetical protein